MVITFRAIATADVALTLCLPPAGLGKTIWPVGPCSGDSASVVFSIADFRAGYHPVIRCLDASVPPAPFIAGADQSIGAPKV